MANGVCEGIYNVRKLYKVGKCYNRIFGNKTLIWGFSVFFGSFFLLNFPSHCLVLLSKVTCIELRCLCFSECGDSVAPSLFSCFFFFSNTGDSWYVIVVSWQLEVLPMFNPVHSLVLGRNKYRNASKVLVLMGDSSAENCLRSGLNKWQWKNDWL